MPTVEDIAFRVILWQDAIIVTGNFDIRHQIHGCLSGWCKTGNSKDTASGQAADRWSNFVVVVVSRRPMTSSK